VTKVSGWSGAPQPVWVSGRPPGVSPAADAALEEGVRAVSPLYGVPACRDVLGPRRLTDSMVSAESDKPMPSGPGGGAKKHTEDRGQNVCGRGFRCLGSSDSAEGENFTNEGPDAAGRSGDIFDMNGGEDEGFLLECSDEEEWEMPAAHEVNRPRTWCLCKRVRMLVFERIDLVHACVASGLNAF